VCPLRADSKIPLRNAKSIAHTALNRHLEDASGGVQAWVVNRWWRGAKMLRSRRIWRGTYRPPPREGGRSISI
jgi:hypothetical protein